MQVKIKKLSDNAVVPKYGTDFAAGADLVATSKTITPNYISYGTGFAFELPPGYCGFLFQRSSVSNTDLTLANAIGLLDEDFRGEVSFRFRNVKAGQPCVETTKMYEVGDRIGQIVIVPYNQVQFEIVDELTDSKRGEGSYGSTGV